MHLIPKNLSEWSRKRIQYAERKCTDRRRQLRAPVGLVGSGRRKRILKEMLYYKSPQLLRAVAMFVFRYVLQLGFLDGKIGFVYHLLQCLWYRVLIDSLISEEKQRPTGIGVVITK